MTAEDRRNLELIREHITDLFADPSDDDCISFALQKAAKDFEGKPKPRHPRTIK